MFRFTRLSLVLPKRMREAFDDWFDDKSKGVNNHQPLSFFKCR